MSPFATILLAVFMLFLLMLAVWGYLYWHQTTALKADMERLYATHPEHWKPGQANPWRGFEYTRDVDGSFKATRVHYPTPSIAEQAEKFGGAQ